MQNKLLITIVDEKGSKQFHAHKHIKKIIFWGIIILISIVIALFLIMKLLMNTISEIALDQNIVISEYRYLYQQNENLKNKIQQKNNELNMIYQKINDLENIIGTQKNNQKNYKKPDYSELLTNLDHAHKDLILTLIPNGSPVQYETSYKNASLQKNPKQKLGLEFSSKEEMPVYATSDGVIDRIDKNRKKSYGSLVKMTHSFGFSTIYAHLKKISVFPGDFIRKGDLIGYADFSTLRNTYILYYEVLFLNKTLDTKTYTEWNLDNFNQIFEDENMDWGDLLYTIKDILKLRSYGTKDNEK